MQFMQTIIAFLVALGVLIAFHEWGHYLVARACGVKILRFCLGFGIPVVSRRWGKDQTEWGIAAFPLGGYVKMLDEREGPVAAHELHRAFTRQSVPKRMAILVAGPVFNFILAIALYWGVFGVGMQEPKALVAAPPAGSQAAKTGRIEEGAVVLAINGEMVQSWNDLRWRMLKVAVDQGSATLELASPGGARTQAQFSFAGFTAQELEGDVLRNVGLTLSRPQPTVQRALEASPAAKAGMLPGDTILRIGGKAVATGEAAIQEIRAAPGKATLFDIQRGNTVVQLTITPDAVKDDGGKPIGRIGAEIGGKLTMVTVSYGILGSLAKAVTHTWDMSLFSLKMMGKMITGQVSAKNISGPVTIADYAGKSARMGLDYYVSFLALISVSLGVLNLLPIPLLDGGSLLFFAIEGVRGKPVSESTMEWAQRFGLVALASLMVFALWNDFERVVFPLIAHWF
jgi:regulator of sigma E protease